MKERSYRISDWVSWVDLGNLWVGYNQLIIRLGKMGRIFDWKLSWKKWE